MRLDVHGLSFAYPGCDPVIEGWNATFEPGQVVAITGPSGSGKSTLLYMLGLMLRPTGGDIRLGGRSVAALPDRHRAAIRARQFGFVFQDAALDVGRTVIDNVVETALYRRQDRAGALAEAQRLLSRFGVGLRATARPGQVSGGQAQRIALCRALLGRPEVLLADEPTGNLDPASADVVVEAFHEHAATGAAVIVVTHDPRVVARCDREIRL